MFHILFIDLQHKSDTQMRHFLNQIHNTTIYESNQLEQALLLCQQIHMDCIVLVPDISLSESMMFLTHFRTIPQYLFTPVLIFSAELIHTSQMYTQFHICEFFHFPLTENEQTILQNLLMYYQDISTYIQQQKQNRIPISTPTGIHILHYDEIIFGESIDHKLCLHTKTQTFMISTPISKFCDNIKCDYLMQTHRSFFINIHHIRSVEKSKFPWKVSFFDTNECAYISKSYKDHFLQSFLFQPREMND